MIPDLVGKINKEPLWQQVANAVRRSIQSSLLQPGDRIVEQELEERLGVSRTPVREALRQLQNQGILDYKPNAGTTVAGISRADSALILNLRAYLESSAIDLIYDDDTSTLEEKLEPLEEIVKAMQALGQAGTLEDGNALDEEFHDALISVCGSSAIRRIWGSVDLRTLMYLPDYRFLSAKTEAVSYQTDYLKRGGLYGEHRRLLDALKSGDRAAAHRVMRHHMEDPWNNNFAGEAPTTA